MPTQIVEVYGTVPEAQRYIAEHYGISGRLPRMLVLPPLDPSKQPVRAWVGMPIPRASGFGTDEQGSAPLTLGKGLLIAGLVALGWTGAAFLGFYASKFEREEENV